jgi:hypothetical protein
MHRAPTTAASEAGGVHATGCVRTSGAIPQDRTGGDEEEARADVTPTADRWCRDPGSEPATRSRGPAGSTCGGRARGTGEPVQAAFEVPVPVEPRSRRALLTCTRRAPWLQKRCRADDRRRGCPARRPRGGSFRCCRWRTWHSEALHHANQRRRLSTPSCQPEDAPPARLATFKHIAARWALHVASFANVTLTWRARPSEGRGPRCNR